MNGDGKLDLVVANADSNSVSLLLGNGNGIFQSQRTLATGHDPVSLACKDLNHDGRPDIIVENNDTFDTTSILTNNGNGIFQAQRTYSSVGGPGIFLARILTVADINGDGNPDIVTGSVGVVGVLSGNGNGEFGLLQTFATGVKCSVGCGRCQWRRKGRHHFGGRVRRRHGIQHSAEHAKGTFQQVQMFSTPGWVLVRCYRRYQR